MTSSKYFSCSGVSFELLTASNCAIMSSKLASQSVYSLAFDAGMPSWLLSISAKSAYFIMKSS